MSEFNFEKVENNLIDIRDVHIDANQSREERVRSYVEQIKDPYNFRVGDVIVHVAYSDNERSINDSFSTMLSSI